MRLTKTNGSLLWLQAKPSLQQSTKVIKFHEMRPTPNVKLDRMQLWTIVIISDYKCDTNLNLIAPEHDSHNTSLSSVAATLNSILRVRYPA